MAENLQLLKKRIKTAQNIAQISKAMEMIAASKIKKAQNAVESNRPYATRITQVVERLLANCELQDFSNPYLTPPPSDRKLLIAISPDKGLCGGLATNLARALDTFDPATTVVLTVGKKIEHAAVASGFTLAAAFPMGTTFPRYQAVFPILDVVNSHFLTGKVGEVHFLYTEFKSMMTQKPVTSRLLPVAVSEACLRDDIPYAFEPNVETILGEMLPYYVEVELYHALMQAFTSEQAARMVAMQSAKDNALDITDVLTNSYNRSRQERITNEILDLSNGQIA